MSVNYLPFSLVADVSIAKNTNFPASKSFQTLLILAVGLTVEIRAKLKSIAPIWKRNKMVQQIALKIY